MAKLYVIIGIISTLAGFGGGMITSKRLEKPVTIPEYKCPDCNCPANNSIDFDKIKGRGVKLQVNQHYHVEIDGDSLALERIKLAVEEKLRELKVSRCK